MSLFDDPDNFLSLVGVSLEFLFALSRDEMADSLLESFVGVAVLELSFLG